MKKSLLAATAFVSLAVFAETPLKDLRSLPAELFLPEDAVFVEGEDDGTGGIDVKVTTSAGVADVAAMLQAKAKEQGLAAETDDVSDKEAKFEFKKMDSEGNVPDYTIDYTVQIEGGKTTVEAVFLDSRNK